MNELYNAISAGICNELCQHEEHAIVATGTTLIEEGTVPDHLIIIEEGRVEIVLWCPNDGKSLIFGHEGQILGLSSIITGAPEAFDVRTIEACAISKIRADIFLDVLNRHPELYVAIAKLLCKAVTNAERLLREVRLAPARHYTNAASGIHWSV